MRQYSRMVSCSYIAIMMMCPWIFMNPFMMGSQLCLIATISLLFTTYQNRNHTGPKLWAYAFFGVSVILWPPLIVLLPVFWIGEAFFLMAFGGKAFGASIFGLLMPLWILTPFVIFMDAYDAVLSQVEMILPGEKLAGVFHDFSLLKITALPLPLYEVCVVTLVLLLLLTGVVHYFRHSYIDKIQTRMYYQFFTLLAGALVVFFFCVLLLPCQTLPGADVLFSFIVVCTSPLIAHYITFTSTRITNISVVVLMIITMVTGVIQCIIHNAPFIIHGS